MSQAAAPSRPADARQRVQSVEVGMRLVQALADAGRALGLTDLATAANMPPAKAHRYLQSLIATGMAEQVRETGRYDLGPAALGIGLAALGRIDPVRIASSTLADLRDAIEESVFLAVWGNRGPTIVRWEESTRPVTVNVRVGSVLPLLNSATGRIFTAYLPPETYAPILEEETKGSTLSPAIDAERLREDVRDRGLARVTGDLLLGISALSVPVFDHQNAIVCALTALGADGSFDASLDGELARRLCDHADALSRRLGFASAVR